jgi:Tol biopolymer transport system component
VGIGERTLPDGTEELVTVSITTGEVTRLKKSDGHDVRPVISKDRRTVVYLDRASTPARLRVMAADGTQARDLVRGGPIQGCSDFARPAWHSRTDLLVLTCLEADRKNKIRSLRLLRLDDPSRSTRLLDIGPLSEPTFTPDGSRIVYWKGLRGGDGGSIYVLDVTTPGAEAIRLTTSASDKNPAVSPDGRTVVFRRNDGGREGLDLYSVPVAGGAATRLTRGSSLDESPAWSPDGSQILFNCGPRRPRFLCLVGPDGQDRQVLPGPSGVITMAWSPR